MLIVTQIRAHLTSFALKLTYLLTGEAVIFGLRLAGEQLRSFLRVVGVCGGVEKPCSESLLGVGGVLGGVHTGLEVELPAARLCLGDDGGNGLRGGESLYGTGDPMTKNVTHYVTFFELFRINEAINRSTRPEKSLFLERNEPQQRIFQQKIKKCKQT